MDPNDTTALCDPDGGRGHRRGRSLMNLEIQDRPEEGLVGRREQQRRTESRQFRRLTKQLQRLRGRLAQVQPGVQNDLFVVESGREGPPSAFEEERAHRGGDVVVVRVRIRDARSQADVRGDHGRLGRRRGLEVLGVGEATDVVAEAGTGRKAGPGDRRPPGVHTERHVETGAQLANDRHDAVELFFLADLIAGTGFHSAHVQDVGALVDELFGAREKSVQVVGGRRSVERVARSIQDTHHQGPSGHVHATRPHGHHQWPLRPKDRH